MNRVAARFLLQPRTSIVGSVTGAGGATRESSSNNIFDAVKEGVKQTCDLVGDTAKNLSQTSIKFSSQGIEISEFSVLFFPHFFKTAFKDFIFDRG